MLELDAKDQGLLNLLRNNARISVVELAKKTGLSRATVQSRINRLEKREVILGYTVILGADTKRPEVKAMMCISVESVHEASVIKNLR